AWRPRRLVADLRRPGDARLVARSAHRLHHFLAALGARRAARGAELDVTDRLQALRHRFGRERIRIRAALAGDELHEKHDADHRYGERRDDDDDELLRRLDERDRKSTRL